jgi:hypothetical protein
VLRAVAALLTLYLGADALLARVSDDRFAAITNLPSFPAVHDTAQALMTDLEWVLSPVDATPSRSGHSVRMGIAWLCDVATDWAGPWSQVRYDAMNAADVALRAARAHGDGWQLFVPEANSSAAAG